MIFEPKLESAILIKRYKRFLADVIHPTLGEITVHCPNTGSMKNCWSPGWMVWLQKSDNPKRKYPYTWVLTKNDEDEWIGINTNLANQLVYEGLTSESIGEIENIAQIDKEVKYGDENSRIDLLVTHQDQSKTYIEVKSVTLKLDDDHLGAFPDAVTLRGQKHIRELIHRVEQGDKAVLFFMAQHTGIKKVTVAKDIDPDYAALLKEAITKGVKVLSYSAEISADKIVLGHSLDFIL